MMWLALALAANAPLRADALDGSTFAWPRPGGKAACLVFVAADCPISNAYAPEVGRVVKDFAAKGVSFAVVYAAPDLTAADAKTHAREFAFPCPAVLDSRLTLAKRTGATVVPEAVVLSPANAVLYRGRIDDRWAKAGGKRRENPTTRDLRDALELALRGKPTPTPWPAAVGCDIDFPE
jgi:hypothetical protein